MHRFRHELGLHTALDTSGFLGSRAHDALVADTDLVLLDIKSWEPGLYRELTGRELRPALDLARRLETLGKEVRVRFVVVPGLTDGEADVEGVAAFAGGLPNVTRVDALPFHKPGAGTYEALGKRFPPAATPSPDPQVMDRVRAQLRAHGLHMVRPSPHGPAEAGMRGGTHLRTVPIG
nr:hypothetical protein [Streptomyces fildesensis]